MIPGAISALPPVLLINLARSVDRLRTATAELERVGLPFERLDAVEGAALSAEERARIAPWDPRAYYQSLSPGEIGCYLSHIAAAERIVREGWPRALVLEDDFRVRPDAVDTLRAVLALPGPVPDVIKLEGTLSGGTVRATLPGGVRLMRHRRPPARTVAMLWSLDGAKRFLAIARPLRRPIDVQLKHWWEGPLDVAYLDPAPFTQHVEHTAQSTIAGRRTSGPAQQLRRLRYRWMFALESRVRYTFTLP